jgi:hypothetical protein
MSSAFTVLKNVSTAALMLLYLSSGASHGVRHTKMSVDFANDVAFQASYDLALTFTVDSSLCHVSLCRPMISHSDDGHAVECGIGLPVPAAIQAHAVSLAA